MQEVVYQVDALVLLLLFRNYHSDTKVVLNLMDHKYLLLQSTLRNFTCIVSFYVMLTFLSKPIIKVETLNCIVIPVISNAINQVRKCKWTNTTFFRFVIRS